MVLPAFASIDDLRARGVKIATGAPPNADETRAQAALDDVSALIRTVGIPWVDDADALVADLPPIVFTICCAAARRAYENPQNVRSENIDGFGDTIAGDVIGGVELSEDEKKLIARAAGGNSPRLGTISTTRGILETLGPFDAWDSPVLMGTDGAAGGEPIAWLDPSEIPPPLGEPSPW